eukprot:5501522-Prymnesium_polylepis.1
MRAASIEDLPRRVVPRVQQQPRARALAQRACVDGAGSVAALVHRRAAAADAVEGGAPAVEVEEERQVRVDRIDRRPPPARVAQRVDGRVLHRECRKVRVRQASLRGRLRRTAREARRLAGEDEVAALDAFPIARPRAPVLQRARRAADRVDRERLRLARDQLRPVDALACKGIE